MQLNWHKKSRKGYLKEKTIQEEISESFEFPKLRQEAIKAQMYLLNPIPAFKNNNNILIKKIAV